MMRDHRLLRGFCICVVLLTSVFAAHGQSTTSLRGVITDQTGAIIPGAVVSLTNDGTVFKRQALTGEAGVYQFLQAPPGTYHVAAEKAGFAIVTRDSVQLQVNTPGTLGLRMEVGSTSDVVNVAADATTINTVDASSGNPFSEHQVRQVPWGERARMKDGLRAGRFLWLPRAERINCMVRPTNTIGTRRRRQIHGSTIK